MMVENTLPRFHSHSGRLDLMQTSRVLISSFSSSLSFFSSASGRTSKATSKDYKSLSFLHFFPSQGGFSAVSDRPFPTTPGSSFVMSSSDSRIWAPKDLLTLRSGAVQGLNDRYPQRYSQVSSTRLRLSSSLREEYLPNSLNQRVLGVSKGLGSHLRSIRATICIKALVLLSCFCSDE